MAKEISIEESTVIKMALSEYSKGKADFANYLIAVINSHAGCLKTVTFDKSAALFKRFKLL